ncbi:RodZ domain-containing protein [Marinobacterium lutimaris]|uniref:Cytoskeleton protein RodZ n=1 Tax=Marinobacterium lutimaris TaxID=568106 RepID=A0A1H6DPM4_9GAMM|nr:RodZ domain-containing protein [Marinobacterium lutimaris]SEG86596.1 cytoskeleton protein RodZ [Marinobacterium lutimaris]
MSSEEISQDAGATFSGGNFVKARESLGVSLQELSRELHLPVRTLEAIERGEFKGLGGPVFVRGYIRSYARRLKMNPDTYVSQFDRLSGIKDTAAAVRAVGTVSTSPARQSRSLMRVGTLIFIVAIVGFIVWWWQTQYSIDSVLTPAGDSPVTVDTADGNTLVLPPLDDEAVAAPAGELPAFNSPDSVGAEAGLAEEIQETAASAALPALPDSAAATETVEGAASPEEAAEVEEAEAAPAVAATDDQFRLVLADESWLSVKDATGRTLFNGIAQPGSELTFEGEEPLAVVIGRASAVTSIEYRGEPVDLSQASDNNVARLRLPTSLR